MRNVKSSQLLPGLILAFAGVVATDARAQTRPARDVVDATTLDGKMLAGYQGWFRCAGDAAGGGWVHWSRDRSRITPETLTFEMWPAMRDYGADERFVVPGFTHPDGSPAELFSSDNAATVLRHFQWMRQYDLDGVWLQEFLVDMPGGSNEAVYPSRLRVLHHVADAATRTGRTWAVSYDTSGLPPEKISLVLTRNWKQLVDENVLNDARYLHHEGKPVVQFWGLYFKDRENAMSPEQANAVLDFLQAPGKYSAFVVGGGAWDWNQTKDPKWQAVYRRLGAYIPWNTGNYFKDNQGVAHASTGFWADDKKAYEQDGRMWIPVVYPGFSWDNLKQQPPGASTLPRRGGEFLWEQFAQTARLKPRSVFVAMFDEVDEGTAIFKVTSTPPRQAHFITYDGLPSDWYLRLVGAGGATWRGEMPLRSEIPIKP